MRKIRTAVFAGIAALTAAGTAVAATADTRVVNVGLPDGSVAPESLSEILETVPVTPTTELAPLDAHALTGSPGQRREPAPDTGAAPNTGAAPDKEAGQ